MTDKSKRHLSPSGGGGGGDELAASKRARLEQDDDDPARALVPAGAPQSSAAGGKKGARANNGGGGVPRTSSLAAPTMRLTGHVGEVFAAAFSPGDGGDSNGGNVLLASAGFDRSVLLWRASGECDNVAALHGHKNAVLSLAWLGGFGSSSDAVLLSASADGTARAWSVERGAQVKRAAEHGRSVVNCVAAAAGGGAGAPPIFVTAGDDGVAVREKKFFFCGWERKGRVEGEREREQKK